MSSFLKRKRVQNDYPPSLKKRKYPLCQKKGGCGKIALGDGKGGPRIFCSNHGGGTRCQQAGCEKGALGDGKGGKAIFCGHHGGGARCRQVGCGKIALGDGKGGKAIFCGHHGGGARCQQVGCRKCALGDGKGGKAIYCLHHGGGNRCRQAGCEKIALGDGKRGKAIFCVHHGGGARCQQVGCQSFAKGNGKSDKAIFCVHHGGGARCQQVGCQSLAKGDGKGGPMIFCSNHGGGARCQEADCGKWARLDRKCGKAFFCVNHGGGPRCEIHYKDLANPAYAGYIVSKKASLRIDNKDVPQPDFVGKRACMDCLRHCDPSNASVRRHVRKEVEMVNALVERLCQRGYAHLVDAHSNSRHDCAIGPSMRRPDVYLDLTARLKVLIEIDENGHRDRDTSCEHAKLAGTLMDFGAPGFTKEEGHAMDVLETNIECMSAFERADLQRIRARALERVLQGSTSLECKLHLLRVNPDAYVEAETGKRIEGLFKNRKNNEDLNLKKTKQFAITMDRIVDRLVLLCAQEQDDRWFHAHKELETEYMRFE